MELKHYMRITMIEYVNTNKVTVPGVHKSIHTIAKKKSKYISPQNHKVVKQVYIDKIQLYCVLQTTYGIVHFSLQIETNEVWWI